MFSNFKNLRTNTHNNLDYEEFKTHSPKIAYNQIFLNETKKEANLPSLNDFSQIFKNVNKDLSKNITNNQNIGQIIKNSNNKQIEKGRNQLSNHSSSHSLSTKPESTKTVIPQINTEGIYHDMAVKLLEKNIMTNIYQNVLGSLSNKNYNMEIVKELAMKSIMDIFCDKNNSDVKEVSNNFNVINNNNYNNNINRKIFNNENLLNNKEGNKKKVNVNINLSENFLKKKRENKYITMCPHPERKHYAKNMCSNCYHSSGREKKAWKCPHHEKNHYARGFCHACYQFKYNRRKIIVKVNVNQSNADKKSHENSNIYSIDISDEFDELE